MDDDSEPKTWVSALKVIIAIAVFVGTIGVGPMVCRPVAMVFTRAGAGQGVCAQDQSKCSQCARHFVGHLQRLPAAQATVTLRFAAHGHDGSLGR
jgi:hypothetical protein